MLILALDSTARAGSIALVRDATLVDSVIGDSSRTHAERIPADVHRLLARNDVAIREVDVFAVASGPGSFTGLRIGIAAIQGLAFANLRPVAAVSALDALAVLALQRPTSREPTLVAAWMDAHRQEVFSALYRPSPAPEVDAADSAWAMDGLGCLDEASVGDPSGTLNRWARPVAGCLVRFIGDGAVRYRRTIEEHLGGLCEFVEPVPPLAPAIAMIGAWLAGRGLTFAPHGVRPVYVRRPDAELARERWHAHSRDRR